tara:strand:- start:1617 stop:1727 length:111 start_codon:yes stop_codon:yes gene_type:complete
MEETGRFSSLFLIQKDMQSSKDVLFFALTAFHTVAG